MNQNTVSNFPKACVGFCFFDSIFFSLDFMLYFLKISRFSIFRCDNSKEWWKKVTHILSHFCHLLVIDESTNLYICRVQIKWIKIVNQEAILFFTTQISSSMLKIAFHFKTFFKTSFKVLIERSSCFLIVS